MRIDDVFHGYTDSGMEQATLRLSQPEGSNMYTLTIAYPDGRELSITLSHPWCNLLPAAIGHAAYVC